MAAWMKLGASLLSGVLANREAKKAQGAANEAADFALSESQLREYQGLFGGYDPDSGEYLNTEFGDMMNQYMNRSTNAFNQIGNFSPEQYAEQMYQTDLALLNPEFEQQALEQESRLAQQGRLGTTGGAGAYGGLMQAQNMNRMKARQQSYVKSQQQLDNMRRRQQEDMMAAIGIGQLATPYGKMSMDQARFRSGNAWNAANMRSGAALGRAGAMAGLYGSALKGFNSQENISNPFAGMFSRNRYTPPVGTSGYNIHSMGK
jgi:hypothetical protein|tara:strand:- start:110 stop:892 length:783 start_codon:yes stop_codon:yes gene_type:complete